jgi:hypothetical protein
VSTAERRANGPDRIPDVSQHVPAFVAYLQKPENGAGGSLHIWLDDDNIEDSHIQFCLECAESIGDTDGVELARLGLRMSKTQRSKLLRLIDAAMHPRPTWARDW